MTDTKLAIRPSEAGPSAPESPSAIDTSAIVGWGVDANPQNDPTYPYRDRSADDRSGDWRRPTLQHQDVELLQSVEHRQLPAVFGTANPPKWASGAMRRLAFRWSESHWAHWLLLMGADRVNMVEGLMEDVAKAKIPNIPKEMGMGAEWRHNKKGLALRLGTAAVLAGAVFAWRKSRRQAD